MTEVLEAAFAMKLVGAPGMTAMGVALLDGDQEATPPAFTAAV